MGRWSGGSIYPKSNDEKRDAAKAAGGFTTSNKREQEEAYDALVESEGGSKKKANKRIEDEAISAGAKPKGWRRITGR